MGRNLSCSLNSPSLGVSSSSSSLQDKVWYQFKDTVAWHGPASVICQRGNTVYVHANGEVKKLAACRVKPCELRERKSEKKEEQNKERDEDKWNRWIEEDGKMEEEKGKTENEDEENEEIEEEDMVMTEDGLKDAVGAKYLRTANSVCFLESLVYVVEVPVKEHGKPEVKEAKEKKIKNLETYETFEEVEDETDTRRHGKGKSKRS